MQIRELERFLEVELIERAGRGDAHRTWHRDRTARGCILSATTDLVDLAHHGSRVLTGTLRLGVIPHWPYVLPNVLRALGSKASRLCLDWSKGGQALLAELTRGTLDVVLLALPIDKPELTRSACSKTVLLAGAGR